MAEKSFTNSLATHKTMSDEETKGASEEERRYQDALVDLDNARKDLDDAREKLRKESQKLQDWEDMHGDDNDRYCCSIVKYRYRPIQ